MISPVNKVFYVIGSKFKESFNYVFGTKKMREDNQKLIVENAKLKKNVDNLNKVIGDKRYLQEEYELLSKDRTIKTKAFITGKDPGNIFTRFSIDKGSMDKIKKGDIVIEAVSSNDGIEKGLVGVVTEVGLNHSKVDTIMNSGNNVGFRLAKSEDVGILNEKEKDILKGYMYDSNELDEQIKNIFDSFVGHHNPSDTSFQNFSVQRVHEYFHTDSSVIVYWIWCVYRLIKRYDNRAN